MSNVVNLPVVTKLAIDPKKVLSAALEVDWSMVIIVGVTEDGREYFASSEGDGPQVLWNLERAKKRLLSMVESDQP